MNNIDQYKIIKKINFGMRGTIFLVQKNDKQYALKIEHILKSDINTILKREIEFNLYMYKHYPLFFMKLYDHDIIDNCKHEQAYPQEITKYSNVSQKILKQLADSTYCSRKIFSLIDFTFLEIIKKLSKQQIYSMIIQVTYILHIIHKNGYVHGDFHGGNLGLVKSSLNYIQIKNLSIPTFGYIYQVVDYYEVLHKKYKLNKRELSNYYNAIINETKYAIINLCVQYTNKPKIISDNDILQKLKKNNEYINLSKQFGEEKDCIFLFQLKYPHIYNTFVNDIDNIDIPTMYITIDDVEFILHNYKKYDDVIMYFYKKIVVLY